MNCYSAQQLLSAERDGPLPSDQGIALETHLGACSGCREARSLISASIAAWRTSAKSIQTPDLERAWQDIRRATRVEPPHRTRSSVNALRWVAPVGIAAGLAFVASVSPRWQYNAQAAPIEQGEAAHADFVDVPNNASSMVYVDDQSGWLVVWSDGDSQPSGS